MSTAPSIELGFSPTDLRPQDLPRAGAFLGSPANALEAALAVTRAAMIDQMRSQVRGLPEPTHAQLLRLADLAWEAVFWKYRKISAPVIADAYVAAYRRADAGDVPISVIYDLADKHAEKVGEYFHATSRDALAQGFSTLVNRRLPAKAAADRVLDAYGLTPRQMRGYLSAQQQFSTPISDVLPRSLKAKARAYIDKAFTTRIRKLSRQEEHNIDQQAQQFAWMWLQDKGRLSEKAQKMWITAHDEKVCPLCGPLHGQKVGVNEQFHTKEGQFWTPGLHPNCRCVVRLIENVFTKALAGTTLAEFNHEHPRAYQGRFSTKARTKTINVDEEFDRIISTPVRTPVRHLTYSAPPMTQPAEPDTDREFTALIEGQPKLMGFSSPWESPLARREFLAQAQTHEVEPMYDFAADLVLDTRASLKTDPFLKPTKAPTIALGQPAFAVVTHDQLDDGDIDRIRFNHGIEFKTDEIAAAQEAGEYIQTMVNRRIEDMVDQGNRVDMQDEKTGMWYSADLSPEDIKRIAEWYANTATAHWHEDYDSNFIGDDQILMDWELDDDVDLRYDTGYTTLPDRMRYSTIGEQYGLRSEDFETYLVRIDRAPAAEGAVEHISGGEQSRHRSFSVDGEYDYVPGSISKTVHDNGYAVTTFKMEPKDSVQLPEEDQLNYPDRSDVSPHRPSNLNYPTKSE